MKHKIKKIFENAVWWSGVVMVGLILGISLQFVKAWTEPTEAPPNGNVGAPINTSVNPQTKGLGGVGSLGIAGVLDAFGLKVRRTSDANGIGVIHKGDVLVAQADPLNPDPTISDGQVAWAAGGGESAGGGLTATMMSGKAGSALNHPGACKYCYDLNASAAVALNGDTATVYSGWRLPSVAELAVFRAVMNPLPTLEENLWTATPFSQVASEGIWITISFLSGAAANNNKSVNNTLDVRCVR